MSHSFFLQVTDLVNVIAKYTRAFCVTDTRDIFILEVNLALRFQTGFKSDFYKI